MGVNGVVRIRLVCNVCTSGRCVRLGSTGSALGIAGFVRVCLLHLGAPRGSLDSFQFVWVRRGGRWVLFVLFVRSRARMLSLG